MLKSEGLVRLVELESNDQLSALPSAAKRGIAKALVLAGGACEDQASSQFLFLVFTTYSVGCTL